MKSKLLVSAFLLIIAFTLPQKAICCIEDDKTNSNQTCENNNRQSATNYQTVYVCTGTYAYAYHSRSDCPGLGNCKGDIKATDEYTATNQLGRKPCCRCWSNVNGNCHDDNPNANNYYGGGGSSYNDNSDAYAYAALAMVVVGAAIISNDIYLYPVYSFYKGSSNDYYNSQYNKGKGWSFGFRKTFKHCALEYGASYMNFTSKNNYYFSENIEQEQWGGQLNFVHHLFYNKTPEWLNFYIGPTINYVFDFGYGGIVGTEFKIFDRLKFDVRYEYTNQTNQIQAGLIFTYQKKYFWNK